jgi:hypothetical protein
VEDASVRKMTRTSSGRQIFKARVPLKKKCLDCITGITTTNKIVNRILSRIICVAVVIEPIPIHSIAYIHHPATLTQCIKFSISGIGSRVISREMAKRKILKYTCHCICRWKINA